MRCVTWRLSFATRSSALIDEGVPYIQLDAPGYTAYVDDVQRERMRANGTDPDALFSEIVEADNSTIQGLRREGLTIAIHLCRGNNRSHWLSEGSYEIIAERLFNGLDVDAFLLEYDNDRSGGFEPLRFVPRGKTVVLGLITSKDGRLESLDDLRRRIEEASKYVPDRGLGHQPAVWFRLGGRGQRHLLGGPASQVGAGGGNSPRRLGLIQGNLRMIEEIGIARFRPLRMAKL